MKTWQRYWLYVLIFYSSIHIIRDLFQDFGINNFLSTILVKQSGLLYPWVQRSLPTYVIAITEILISFSCLKKNVFSIAGQITILIAIMIFLYWSYYWFFL